MAGKRAKMIWREYWKEYRRASRVKKGELLDEFCRRTGYNRKYAIQLLGRPPDEERPKRRRRRKKKYPAEAVWVLRAIWKAAGYPWSVRLKASLPLWLPWARRHMPYVTPEVEKAVLSISARQIDRYLAPKRREVKRRLYGRTKPGTLLRRQIPVRTQHWDVKKPGFTEADTVSHSGPSATGEWIHSLNMTDIFSGWVETRAIMGASEYVAVEAIEEIRKALPFDLLGIDSDNGSEFINYHLLKYCEEKKLDFTRSRPYKKDDNAHIEQKNWTHVRKVFGWQRYDTEEQQEAMNALYRSELRIMMNLFQPSVKLIEKHHIGSRVVRRYDAPQTPLDRLVAFYGKDALPRKLTELLALRQSLDPFELSKHIDKALERLNLPRKPNPKARRREGCPRAALSDPHEETSNVSFPR